MKEPQWDDSVDDAKDYFDAAAVLSDDEVDELDEEPVRAVSAKTHFTDLRRRIEERMDSKRIDHEFAYDDLDSLLDELS